MNALVYNKTHRIAHWKLLYSVFAAAKYLSNAFSFAKICCVFGQTICFVGYCVLKSFITHFVLVCFLLRYHNSCLFLYFSSAWLGLNNADVAQKLSFVKIITDGFVVGKSSNKKFTKLCDRKVEIKEPWTGDFFT